MTSAPDYSLEALAAVRPVCGVDEAGRGPIAGPVVAAAVTLDSEQVPAGIDDSKRLSARRRRVLARQLEQVADVGVGFASVGEIDRLNILAATLLAMRRAVQALAESPRLALVDGNRLPPDIGCPARAVVGGDRKSLSIAAASIVAKVRRDRLLRALARDCPGYGWERNAGYPTAEHRQALRRLGPTPHHRRTFAPVRDAMAALDLAGTRP